MPFNTPTKACDVCEATEGDFVDISKAKGGGIITLCEVCAAAANAAFGYVREKRRKSDAPEVR